MSLDQSKQSKLKPNLGLAAEMGCTFWLLWLWPLPVPSVSDSFTGSYAASAVVDHSKVESTVAHTDPATAECIISVQADDNGWLLTLLKIYIHIIKYMSLYVYIRSTASLKKHNEYQLICDSNTQPSRAKGRCQPSACERSPTSRKGQTEAIPFQLRTSHMQAHPSRPGAPRKKTLVSDECCTVIFWHPLLRHCEYRFVYFTLIIIPSNCKKKSKTNPWRLDAPDNLTPSAFNFN